MKTVYSLGDQVLTIKNRDGMPPGQTGIVVEIATNNYYPGYIQVRFDPPVMVGFDLKSTWWFSDHELEMIKLQPLLGDEDEDCV